jgi:hypothetical protein
MTVGYTGWGIGPAADTAAGGRGEPHLPQNAASGAAAVPHLVQKIGTGAMGAAGYMAGSYGCQGAWDTGAPTGAPGTSGGAATSTAGCVAPQL